MIGYNNFFVVAFLTSPLWGGAIYYWLKDKDNPIVRFACVSIGFFSSQAVVWDIIFLCAGVIGGGAVFAELWLSLFGGPLTIWWLLSLIGLVLGLIQAFNDNSTEVGLQGAWVFTFVALFFYFGYRLVAAAVTAIGSFG